MRAALRLGLALLTLVWSFPATAGHVLWNTPGTGNWSSGVNWAGGMVPGPADTAEIGEAAGNGGTAVVDSVVPNIVNLRLGESAGQTGNLTLQTGGSLATTSGDLLVGAGGTGAGTITMTGGDLTVNNGRLELGQSGIGTITQSGGTLTVNNSHVVMGRGATAVSTINLSGGTLQTGGASGDRNLYMAWDNAGSQGHLNVSGTGTVNVAQGINTGNGTANITVRDSGRILAVNTYSMGAGANNLSVLGNGVFTLSNGSILTNNSPATITVADSAAINLTGGSGDGGLVLGRHGTNTATVNQTGGTVTVNNNHVIIGRWDSSQGVYNISGGVLKTAGTSGNRRLHLAWDSPNSRGTLNISGNGQVIVNADNVSGNGGLLAAEQGTAEINVSGNGSLTVYAQGDTEGAMSLGRRGNARATVNQTGGAVTLNNGFLILGRWDNSQGTYNISGGTLQTAGTSGDRNIYLGWDSANAKGTLNVSGTGAVSTTAGALFVGGYGTGTVTQTGGSVTINDNYVRIGRNTGSVGTYDISGGVLRTAGTGGDRTIYLAWDQAGSQGTLNVSGAGQVITTGGKLEVAGWGAGTVNQTGGTVTINDSHVVVGRYNGSVATVNLSGGVMKTAGTTAGGNRRFHLAWDHAGSLGVLNISGNGQLIVNADNVTGATGFHAAEQGTAQINVSGNGSITVYAVGDTEGGMLIGRHGNSSATVNQTGGSVAVHNNYIILGRWDNATGTYNISAGTLQTAGSSGDRNIYLGWDGAGTHGYLNVSGTAQVSTNGGAINVAGNGTATFTQSGGTVTTNNAYVRIGTNNGSVGRYDISAGTLQTAGSSGDRNIYVGWDGATSQGTLNVSGAGTVIGSADIYLGGNGAATVNQTGGAVTAARMVMLGRNPGSSGTYHLDGGMLTTALLTKGQGTASFHFGGGTLKASASFATQLPMTLDAAANIDTGANTVTLYGALSGGGGLNKSGAGALVLAGDNSYAGATAVNQGTLRVGVGVPAVASPPGGAVLWLDATDASTMTFVGGAQVSEWRDKAGGAGLVSQSNPARLPEYLAAGINGNAVLHFDAATQDTLSNTTNYAAPTTILYVARQTGGSNSRVLTSVSNNWLLGYHGGAVNRAYFEGWLTGGTDFPPTNDDPHIFTGVIAGPGVNSLVYADGILIASNTGGTTGPNGLSLNGWQTTSQFSNADYAELLVYNRPLSDAERLAAESYLRAKWFPALNAIPDASPVTVAAGATLDLNGFNETIGSLAGAAGSSVALGGGTLTTGGNGQSTVFAGQISGAGGLVKQGGGTFTLQNANTYAGSTAVHGGTLRVNGTMAGSVTVHSGGWLDGTGTIGGSVDVLAGGGVSAGNSPGHLVVQQTYTQAGTMLAELGGTVQGAAAGGYDWIEVGAQATLGGTVDVDLVGGFYPAIGDSFDILTAGGGITNADLSGVAFDFSGAQLTVAATYWKAAIVPWGGTGGPGEALRLTVAVPEPSTLLLAALGLLALGWHARRRFGRAAGRP